MYASPFGSDEPVAVRVQVRAVHTGRSITGIGATFVGGSVNVTSRVVLPTLPHASVSVSVTVYGPFAGNVCDGADAVLVAVPSPKFHR